MVNEDFEKFKHHLLQIVNISENDLERLISEINDFYSMGVDSFVRSRHSDLQARYRLKNKQIYKIIQKEIKMRKFPVSLTERQIRRIIYG